MTATNLPVSRLINVSGVITPQAVQAQSLSTGLILGTSTVIDTVQRMRIYNTLAAVATDFGTSAEEYLAASLWFGQTPQPISLNIGRWCKLAAAGQLVCGSLTAANLLISAWNAVTTGSFKIAVDGGAVTNVPAMNFSAALTLPGVAAIMQTAVQGLGGAFAAATVTYNSVTNNFVITSGTTGSTSSVSLATAGSTGVDISAMMAGTALTGAYVAPGVAAESALSAVVLFDTKFAGQWYNLTVPDASDTDSVAIAPYIDGDATPHFFWVTTQETQVLALGDTTHIGYLLQQLQVQHTAWQYSSTNPYAAWSMAGRISTVNYTGQNTCISLMYKTEPGVIAESLTATQVNALESYNGNVYVNYQFGTGTPIVETGICPSGQFIDTIQGLDALRLQIQANMFNILLGAPKIPQTDPGVTNLETGADAACAAFVTNGYIAAGLWTGISFGTLVSGQWLDAGFYIYAQSVALQAQSQRAARICPPIQIAVKLAGAIDTAAVTIYAQN